MKTERLSTDILIIGGETAGTLKFNEIQNS